MLSSNSLASITTSSGAGPKPDKSDDRTRAVAVPIRRVPTDVGATPSRYGEKRKFNLPAAALTLLLSAALLAALVHRGYQGVELKAAKLAVVNLERKRVGEGKGVSGREELGGWRCI